MDAFGKTRRKTPSFVLVGDHGESLFADGMLGHGIVMSKEQTQIPVIAAGIPIQAVFPIGIAGVRAMIRNSLAGIEDTPSARFDSDKWIFQYVGALDRPSVVGARSSDGCISYSFRTGKLSTCGAVRPESLPKKKELVELWERIVFRRAESSEETF